MKLFYINIFLIAILFCSLKCLSQNINYNISSENTPFEWVQLKKPDFQTVNLEPRYLRQFEARNFYTPEFLWNSGTPESVYYLQ